jgi:hypothetical protein
MSRRAAILLRVAVLWTVWVWAVLVRNMIVDTKDGWSFRLVHIGLAIVSLAFAVVTWVITTKARRFTRQVERERRSSPDPLRTARALGAASAGMARRWRNTRPAPPRVTAQPPPTPDAPVPEPPGAVHQL